jgi:hypothetical protein
VFGASAAAQAAERSAKYYAYPAVEDQYGVIAPWCHGQNGQFDYRVRIAAETFRRCEWMTPPKVAGIAPGYTFNNTWRITPQGAISLPDMSNWVNAGRGRDRRG